MMISSLAQIRLLCTLLLFGFLSKVSAQTLGGRSVFNFLKLPAAPQLSALGGINVSQDTRDLALSFQNPALLDEQMNGQMVAAFNSFYGGVKNYLWMQGYHHKKLKTDFSAGVHYINYGEVARADIAGNESGTFHPRDVVVQASAARTYEQKWRYGITLKYISSNYGVLRANGIATDVGVLYRDTALGIRLSFVAVNMGAQFKSYGAQKEDLPFDLQLGISKKLKAAPLQFSLTLHHLHQYNIRYNDPLFNEITDEVTRKKSFSLDNVFRHVVLATQLFLGEKVEITAGYNHLRRKELNIANTSNGLNGFSGGIGLLLKPFQIRYARTYYQNNKPYQQIGINLPLNDYFGTGKFGDAVSW